MYTEITWPRFRVRFAPGINHSGSTVGDPVGWHCGGLILHFVVFRMWNSWGLQWADIVGDWKQQTVVFRMWNSWGPRGADTVGDWYFHPVVFRMWTVGDHVGQTLGDWKHPVVFRIGNSWGQRGQTLGDRKHRVVFSMWNCWKPHGADTLLC